jgi:hypothetical protein
MFGEGGSSYSRASEALKRESIDCEDGTRIFGGGTRLKTGEGEFGWLRYCWLSIFLVSKAKACLRKRAILETQNEKLARVFNRWAL